MAGGSLADLNYGGSHLRLMDLRLKPHRAMAESLKVRHSHSGRISVRCNRESHCDVTAYPMAIVQLAQS